MSKYYIKTFGCQANLADTNTIAGLLEMLGFETLFENAPSSRFKNETEELAYVFAHADLVIFNTCSIRQKSEDKVFGIGKIVGGLRHRDKKRPLVVMTGCIVGHNKDCLESLKKKSKWVDLFLDPSHYSELPGLLVQAGLVEESEAKVLENSVCSPKMSEQYHANINISNGCDNFCSYCVVPYTRGREVSRSREAVMGEIQALIKKGMTQVTLCGQNVNSWGLSAAEKFKVREGSDMSLPFAQLVRDVCALPELTKVDFLSSNPFDFTQDLVLALKNPKVAGYIHIPVQSGNNDVLLRMNRRHTVEGFLDLIKRIKEERPDMEIGTDLIVGFPGETEDEFMDTVNLVKSVSFNVIFISMYSPRKGTTAYQMYKNDVPMLEKKRRHAYLTKVWKEALRRV